MHAKQIDMKRLFLCFGLAACLLACNDNDTSGQQEADTTSAHSNHTAPATPAAGNEMSVIMDSMMSSMMRLPMSGDPDLDFAQLMKPHHQSAVQMAQLQLQKGKDTAIRGMAQMIIADQNREISQFEQFIGSHKAAGNDQASSSAMMKAMHQHMQPVSPLTGDTDHDFLSMMIPHHRSAVEMAEVYLPKARDAGMKKLASAIIASQKSEISKMEGLLKNMQQGSSAR